MNHIDEYIVFQPLDEKEINCIVEIQVKAFDGFSHSCLFSHGEQPYLLVTDAV